MVYGGRRGSKILGLIIEKYVLSPLGTISPMNSQMQFRFESYFNPVPRIIRPAFSYIGLAPRMQQYPFLTKYIDIYLVSVSPVPFILLFRLESCTTHTTQLQTFPQPMVLVASWATCGKTWAALNNKHRHNRLQGNNSWIFRVGWWFLKEPKRVENWLEDACGQ